jgi:hypothetical protein
MIRSQLCTPARHARRCLATHATAYRPVYHRYPLLEDRVTDIDQQERSKMPVFSISKSRGFLPRDDPLATLPDAFNPLDSLLNRMTIVQPDGSKGLLAYGQLGHAVTRELKSAGLESQVVRAIETQDQVRPLAELCPVLKILSRARRF